MPATRFHSLYADYAYATAGDLLVGDGIRFLPGTATLPAALAGAMVVTHVEEHAGLVSIRVVDRAYAVNSAMATAFDRDDLRTDPGLLDTFVLNTSDAILLRA